MRGKVAERLFAERLVGITPAYAGKRAASAREAYFIWDHPRVCGEKSNECVKPEIPQGSPPRMRGKVANTWLGRTNMGITPAYAGKSCRSPQGAGRAWDHPRVCGEKIHALLCVPASYGLPPRVRGKGQAIPAHSLGEGITPAYAGKSSTATRAARSTGDHPRVCGEKSKYRLQINWWLGSPPRVRGKAERPTGLLCAAGITPACAGKRSSSSL